MSIARSVLLIAILSTPALAASSPETWVEEAAGPARAWICLRVDVAFTERAPSAVLLETMTSEVSAIWAPYDVQFSWSADAKAADQCEPANGSFDVVIERDASPRAVKYGVVLGRTHLQLETIEHCPIHIDFDATARIVQALSTERLISIAARSSVGSTELGRALGRVLAHEIGHILLAAPSHNTRGLMRATYAADDLAALRRDSFTLSPGEIERLHSRVRAIHASAAPTP